MVLKLNQALYGFQQSLLLWQQKLTNEIKKLGFTEIFQEPYVVKKDGIIAFFLVMILSMRPKKIEPTKSKK